MNKTMSFAQYKKMYITQKQTTDTDTDTDTNTKDDWDFYVNIETQNPNPIQNFHNIDIDINEINESLIDNQIIVASFFPSNIFLKIFLPIVIIIFLY